MKTLILILAAILLASCDITKQAAKHKSDTSLKEEIETKVTRLGDTVTYEVPNIIYRDTVIYTVNRQGTTLKTVYDQSGNISSIECMASRIEELTRINRELAQSVKDKEKDKQENFSTEWILYIVIGIVAIAAIFIFFMFKLINQNAQILSVIADKK